MRESSPVQSALATPVEGPSAPRYSAGAGEILAHFPGGQRIGILRGRTRSYPGLTSAAPRTLPLYELAAGTLSGQHVLDAGTGAGTGLRLLAASFAHVTGVDNDPRALSFCKEYAPSAELVQADLCHGLPTDRADAAVLIDVLGHVARPEEALRNVRACLPAGGRLLVAECESHPSQRLLAPARRAFSRADLERLLLRSGFTLEKALCESGTFLTLLVQRSDDPACLALVEGFRLAGRAKLEESHAAFVRAQQSEHIALRVEALLGQAELYLAQSDGDAAARIFFSLRELVPHDARALTGLARISVATGAFDDAFRLAIDAVGCDPTDSDAYGLLGLAAEQIGHADAFDAWRIAANLAPDAPALATGLARVATARQRYDFAILALERLRDYGDAHGSELHVTLGWLLSAEGRDQDALVEARFAETLDPDNAGVRELLEALRAK